MKGREAHLGVASWSATVQLRVRDSDPKGRDPVRELGEERSDE